jgi:predicted DNA-binding transcriptional regulator AlpA
LKETYNIPLGRRQIDRLEKAGKFPKRVPVGERRVAWVASEIEAHVEALLAKRSTGVGKLGSTE